MCYHSIKFLQQIYIEILCSISMNTASIKFRNLVKQKWL